MRKGAVRFCRGQAVTELMACLIGVCFIVLGMLFVSVVGSKSVRNILDARKEAETKMENGSFASGGKSIQVWYNISRGQGDGLHFTADDSSSSGNAGNNALFRNELVSTAGDFDIPGLAAGQKSESYTPFAMESSHLFLHAADLVEGGSILSDPLGEPSLSDLKRAIQRFGLGNNVTVSDKLYLPNIRSQEKGNGL